YHAELELRAPVVGPWSERSRISTLPPKSVGKRRRGCVRSTSRSDWRERHIEVVSPRLGIRGCCGWSFGHSRAPGQCRDAPSDRGLDRKSLQYQVTRFLMTCGNGSVRRSD